jgi:hypothetical protein
LHVGLEKLKAARDRASQKAGRWIEGRKGHTRGDPDLVALVQSIWRARVGPC